MDELKCIEQSVKNNPIYLKHWIVKNGRKKFAKIYKRCSGEYSVTINNTATWTKNSLIECIDQCNEMAGLIFFNRVIFCKMDN